MIKIYIHGDILSGDAEKVASEIKRLRDEIVSEKPPREGCRDVIRPNTMKQIKPKPSSAVGVPLVAPDEWGLSRQGSCVIIPLFEDEHEWTVDLHLNSDGGSIREAAKIALETKSYRAFLSSDARCISACAIIFLGANFFHHEYGSMPARFLSSGAQLLVHAPALSFDHQTNSVEQLSKAYKASLSAVSQIIEVFEAAGHSSAQIAKLLNHHGDNFHVIDDFADFVFWGVYDNKTQHGPELILDKFENIESASNVVNKLYNACITLENIEYVNRNYKRVQALGNLNYKLDSEKISRQNTPKIAHKGYYEDGQFSRIEIWAVKYNNEHAQYYIEVSRRPVYDKWLWEFRMGETEEEICAFYIDNDGVVRGQIFDMDKFEESSNLEISEIMSRAIVLYAFHFGHAN
ncbi:MAG: hypothetical protein AAFR71_09865 [Pseudomonadota bacterium]